METICPICSCKSGNYKVKANQFSIYKCFQCGLEYTNPIPTNTELEFFYSTYRDIRADSAIVKINGQNNLKKLLKYGLKDDSLILDFGCGKGEFVKIAGKNCYGVELESSDHQRIFNNIDKLPVSQFDYITLWGVLEHINDIKQIMQRLTKFLKKDGYIIITTVNAEGDIPYYYKPPEHLTYWTQDSLNILAKYLNCNIVEISDYKMEQFSHIYLDRLLSRTPKEYSEIIIKSGLDLPKIITVPTNELFAVFKKENL
jgi:2-polyprenyl-3-methyl-5-hydroxy-6-metoxy-1,4-benzoquinol methylase